MDTRFGRNVSQDLANLANSNVSGMSMGRLNARYSKAVSERKRQEAAYDEEVRLNIPQMEQVKSRIAEQLNTEAAEINAKLPVASLYDAYMRVKSHKKASVDPGLRALSGQLERMWKNNRVGSIAAGTYLTLHDHYKRNFPRSLAAQVIEEIGERGYTTLPLSDLTRIASLVKNQADFDREMLQHGLNGPLPHQANARRFILALLNEEDLPEMEFDSPPFLDEEEGDDVLLFDDAAGDRERERQKVREKRQHPRQHSLRRAVALSPEAEELKRMIEGVSLLSVSSPSGFYYEDPVFVAIVHDGSGFQPGAVISVDSISEHGTLEEAYADLETLLEDQMTPEELTERWNTEEETGYDPMTEVFSGRAFKLSAPELEQLISEVDSYSQEKFAPVLEDIADAKASVDEDWDMEIEQMEDDIDADHDSRYNPAMNDEIENDALKTKASRSPDWRKALRKGADQDDEDVLLSRGLHAGNFDAAYEGGEWETNLERQYEEGTEGAGDPAYEAAYIIGFVPGSTDSWMWDDDYMNAWNEYGAKLNAIGLVADDPYEAQQESGRD